MKKKIENINGTETGRHLVSLIRKKDRRITKRKRYTMKKE
jgi:hypothetical protein